MRLKDRDDTKWFDASVRDALSDTLSYTLSDILSDSFSYNLSDILIDT